MTQYPNKSSRAGQVIRGSLKGVSLSCVHAVRACHESQLTCVCQVRGVFVHGALHPELVGLVKFAPKLAYLIICALKSN